MSRTVKEIILHVGMHKTGTSSIQQTLYSKNNEIRLNKKGYHYPKCWDFNHSVPVYSMFCDEPEKYAVHIKMGHDAEKVRKMNMQYEEKFLSEIKQKRLGKVIISGEDISSLPENNLMKFKNYLNETFQNPKITVVFYVRSPISWAVSAVQQVIKEGNSYDRSFHYVKAVLKDQYRSKIDKFLNVFGLQNVNVFSMEDAISHNGGIVGHFLSFLGFSNEINEFEIVRSNESMSLIASFIASYINDQLPMVIDGKLNPLRSYGDVGPLLSIKGIKFDLPVEDKEILHEISYEDAEWLRQEINIDYLNNLQDFKSSYEIKLDDEMIQQIKGSIRKLSDPLRKLANQFFDEQYKDYELINIGLMSKIDAIYDHDKLNENDAEIIRKYQTEILRNNDVSEQYKKILN